jgi:hypothetical protein
MKSFTHTYGLVFRGAGLVGFSALFLGLTG